MNKTMLLLSIAALSAPAMAQFTLVAPNGYAATEGGSNNVFPWGRLTASMRFLQIYDSTHFTNQGANFPILISRVKFRHNAVAATTSWTGGTWPNIVINMSTAAVDYLAANATFANNHGADLTNVLTGPVSVIGGSGAGTTTPGFYYVDIPLATPFVYDPSSGNDLAFEVQLDGTGWTGTATATDAISGTTALPSPPVGSRVFFAGVQTNPTGTVGLNHMLTTEFTYVPATGLYAIFSANVTGGPSPLAVNFSDQSFSSDPGGVTGWAWDFDGDSVIDSNLQNPSFVYNACGTYNVSLTVTDGTHPPNTLTKTAYIRTDLIAANFTSQVTGPLTVQFTDTSSMPATTWAWDLDGDTIVDSNLQNPIWVYPSSAAVNVTLTVTRLCSPPSAITKSVVPVQLLTTNLTANNSVGTPATLYFNLDVLNPAGVTIPSFDSISSTISTPFTVDWYLKLGTHSGFEHNAAPWTFVAQASGTSNAVANQPSPASFAQPLHLPQGSYGVAIRYVGVTPRYVTLTTPTTYGNGDLSLTAGSASLSTAGPFTGTNLNTPRGWSGTIYYGTHNVTGLAGYGFFAPGCAGSMGTSHLSANVPQLGTTLNVNINNLPQSIAIMMIGFSNTVSIFGPLPIDVAPFGAPGCFGRVSTDVTAFLLGAGNTATWSFTIPNDPNLSGLQLYNQGLVLDPGFNTLGAVFSDAAGMILGL